MKRAVVGRWPCLLELKPRPLGFAKSLRYPQDVWSKVAQASHTLCTALGAGVYVCVYTRSGGGGLEIWR